MHCLSFHVAGLEVLLRSTTVKVLSDLRDFYHKYPGRGSPPSLTIDFESDLQFRPHKPVRFDHPKLTSESLAPNQIDLWRRDIEGRFHWSPVGSGPIVGKFRGLCHGACLEAVIRTGTSLALLQKGGLMLHSSAVVTRGKALIFSGVSGAGKSTISALLDELPGYQKVADELLMVTPCQTGGWRLHVGPFLGANAQLPTGTNYPVQAVHFLRQHQAHRLAKLGPVEAFRELLKYVVVYCTTQTTAHQVLECAEKLTSSLPFYSLEFAKNHGVAKVIASA